MVCVIFTDAGLFCFFLANLISILGVNKGDLVKRGEKVLPTDIAFHRHTFGIVFVYSEFFSCKRRDVFEHFFFPQKRSPPKVS